MQCSNSFGNASHGESAYDERPLFEFGYNSPDPSRAQRASLVSDHLPNVSILIRNNVPKITVFANEPFSSPVVSHKAKAKVHYTNIVSHRFLN